MKKIAIAAILLAANTSFAQTGPNGRDGSATPSPVSETVEEAFNLDLDQLQINHANGTWPLDLDAMASDLPRQLIAEDLTVQGSICVGADCNNSESFGFDTQRFKENNLRIKFEDTSASASFPGNDWQITINDSDNGGDNYFAIDDVTSGRQPFRIEAAAPANAIRIDAAGNLGIGTADPVVEIHNVDGDSPTLRLEQDGSAGFGSQTWDVAGNETNFFVRDVTNGSKIPFKIIPDTDNNALYLNSNERVGLMTSSPDARLHIDINGTSDARLLISEDNGTTSEFIVDATGQVGIGIDAPVEKLDVEGAINLGTTTGTNDGSIRWSGTDFEGYQAGDWASLTKISIAGTDGQTLRHNGTDWEASSVVINDGTNVGIGATPAHKLDVAGDINMVTNSSLRINGRSVLRATGTENIFIGDFAGADITTGKSNAVLGYKAGQEMTTGSFNTFLGFKAGQNLTTGIRNVFIGQSAGGNTIDGYNNTFIGRSAGVNNTDGNDNIFIGLLAGTGLSSSVENVLIGNSATANVGVSNSVAIGTDAVVEQSNSMVLGNNLKVGIGTGTPTHDLHVAGDVAIDGMIYDGAGNAGTSGQILTSNGTSLVWTAAPAALPAAGSDQPYQLNGNILSTSSGEEVDLSELLIPMETEIATLQERLSLLEDAVSNCCANVSFVQTEVFDTAKLFQNYPNPTDGRSIIEYFLPAGYSEAHLDIYSITGEFISRINVKEVGHGSVVLAKSALAPGNYVYSLLADDQLIGSKQMTVTQ